MAAKKVYFLINFVFCLQNYKEICKYANNCVPLCAKFVENRKKMKKTCLFVLLMLSVALGMTSCVVNGRDGRDGLDGSLNVLNIEVQVRDYQWKQSEIILSDGSKATQFFCTIDVPEITGKIYRNGTVLCYREYFKGDAARQYQIPLPQTLHDADGPNLYTRTVDYSYGVGFVEIVVTNSDFVYGGSPEMMDFRIQLLW